MTMKEIGERLSFPADLIEALLEGEAQLGADEAFCALRADCIRRMFQHEPGGYKAIAEYAAGRGIDPGMPALLIAVAAVPRAEETYRAIGADDLVFKASARDILLWARDYQRWTGRWGLYVQYGWIEGVLAGQVVRLGRFEYERFRKYGNDPTFRFGDVELTPGTPVVGIHIPEGGFLTESERLDSYRRAYRFFGYSGVVPFLCESWLLDPQIAPFLSPTSGIAGFQSDFRLVRSYPKEDDGDLYRIFGHRDVYDPATLPIETRLQKGVAELLAAGGHLGEGVGVMLFDGERIVR